MANSSFIVRVSILAAIVIGLLVLISHTNASVTQIADVIDLKRLVSSKTRPFESTVQTSTTTTTRAPSSISKQPPSSTAAASSSTSSSSKQQHVDEAASAIQYHSLPALLPATSNVLFSPMMQFDASQLLSSSAKMIPSEARRFDDAPTNEEAIQISPYHSTGIAVTNDRLTVDSQLNSDDLALANSGGQLIDGKFVLPSDQERATELLLAASRLAQRRTTKERRRQPSNQEAAGDDDPPEGGRAGWNGGANVDYSKIVDSGKRQLKRNQKGLNSKEGSLMKLRDQLIDSNENYNQLALMSARKYQQRQLALRVAQKRFDASEDNIFDGIGKPASTRRSNKGDVSAVLARQRLLQKLALEESRAGGASSAARGGRGRIQTGGASAKRRQSNSSNRDNYQDDFDESSLSKDENEDGEYNELSKRSDDEHADNKRSSGKLKLRKDADKKANDDQDDDDDDGGVEDDERDSRPKRRSSSSNAMPTKATKRLHNYDKRNYASQRAYGSGTAVADQLNGLDEDIDSSMNNLQKLALVPSGGGNNKRRLEGQRRSDNDYLMNSNNPSAPSRRSQLIASAAAVAAIDQQLKSQQEEEKDEESASASKQLQRNSGELDTAAGHHHGHHPHYYQYVEVPKKKAWKFGFKRGNHKHEIEKHEKGYKSKFHTTFKWHAKEKCKKKSKCKSVGKMTWEYKHHKKHHP